MQEQLQHLLPTPRPHQSLSAMINAPQTRFAEPPSRAPPRAQLRQEPSHPISAQAASRTREKVKTTPERRRSQQKPQIPWGRGRIRQPHEPECFHPSPGQLVAEKTFQRHDYTVLAPGDDS